uniref:DUF676 domain-containing protein n=1 Tax=Percolomonas cosmopolitus TaxID=63605 RepID=A0A7S1PF47_9EUKA|mmetsp:Transcript_10558/g.39283  ORF Transcript_10558/g.39283 Transcript_10558/m.39283 type:complete len:1103 (+) Transcript_10558:356-3664(+)
MPFFATLELLLSPERLINTDLTKKGVYKLQIAFPNTSSQRRQKYRIAKVSLVPSAVYLRSGGGDGGENQQPDNTSAALKDTPSPVVFLPTDRSLQLRLERHSTQLIYPSNAKIETVHHQTSSNGQASSNTSSSGHSSYASSSSSSSSGSSRRRSSLFGGLVGSGTSASSGGSGVPPKLATGHSNNQSRNSTGKLFKYTSRHFHILYKEQEITFLDNILITVEWMDILHWMQKEEELEIVVELCMLREPPQTDLHKLCDEMDLEWDPEIAFQHYLLLHHNDEAYWDSVLSNNLRINGIWEGVNTVHPVSFNDGWNYCMMWMGVHSCVTRLQYYVGKDDWAGKVGNSRKKTLPPQSPSVTFMKPPLPSPNRGSPRKRSSVNMSPLRSSPKIHRGIPKSASTNSFSSIISSDSSNGSRSVPEVKPSGARRRSSISRRLFSYVTSSSRSLDTSSNTGTSNADDSVNGVHSAMDEYISQKHQRLFDKDFIPYVNQNLKPLWPSIGSMQFYSPNAETLTICTNFVRLIARNWQYMNERLGQILTSPNEGSPKQKTHVSKSSSNSRLSLSPINGGGNSPGLPSPARGRRSFSPTSSVSSPSSSTQRSPSSPSARRRSSNPPPISASTLFNASLSISDSSTAIVNLSEKSALWIPKTYRMLGEKWVQELHELYKGKFERPWMLPYLLNDLFRLPFELDMTIRWKEILQRCSMDLGSVHTELRAQHRRNVEREWYLFVHQPELLEQKNAHSDPVLSQTRVSDSMFPSMRSCKEKHLSQFSIEYLRVPSEKVPPPLMNILSSPQSKLVQHKSPTETNFDPLSRNCKHLIVFVPGFKGSPFDFRLLRFLLELHLYPSQCKYFFFEPQSELYHTLSIRDMATTFAEALTNHIKERKLRFEKISFFAHSLGGLIVRSTLQPNTQAFQIFDSVVPPEKYFTFCTFGSPHLGSFSLKSTLVSTAIYFMSTVQNIKCLQMLSFADEADMTESWLYNLNSAENMRKNFSRHFKHVILCGSKQDTFVNFTSSTVYFDEQSVQSNIGVGSDVIASWVKEFDDCLSNSHIVKMNVRFSPSARSSSSNSFEKFTGKFFHVAYMLDETFLNGLISLHIRDIFAK